jgi:hypothetical protein
MLTALRRRLLPYGAILVAVTLLGAPGQPALAQSTFDEADIIKLVDGLKDGTLPAGLASAECQIGFEEEDSYDNEVREFMAAFLEVPDDLALKAFCDAMISSIMGGSLTKEALILVSRGEENRETALEIGRFIRAVYFAHDRASLISAPGTRR